VSPTVFRADDTPAQREVERLLRNDAEWLASIRIS
jgi:hypothetical protein